MSSSRNHLDQSSGSVIAPLLSIAFERIPNWLFCVEGYRRARQVCLLRSFYTRGRSTLVGEVFVLVWPSG